MPDQPNRPAPRCTDPLLASLTRGLEPADSPAYQSGVVVFIPRRPPPPKPTDDES
jgi:hypothetical protein